jgi:hypothetical protein
VIQEVKEGHHRRVRRKVTSTETASILVHISPVEKFFIVRLEVIWKVLEKLSFGLLVVLFS